MKCQKPFTRFYTFKELNDLCNKFANENAIGSELKRLPSFLEFEKEHCYVGDHGMEIEWYTNEAVSDVG
jgi:hypothetical protein